jgi:hypothetical protein
MLFTLAKDVKWLDNRAHWWGRHFPRKRASGFGNDDIFAGRDGFHGFHSILIPFLYGRKRFVNTNVFQYG